jgi:hypothetical protein
VSALNYQPQVLRLQTNHDYCKRLPLDLCGDIMRTVKPLATHSVRMAVEGSSVARGTRPNWLDSASDIRFIDYSSEGEDTLLHVEAPRLGEAAHEIYEQGELWDTKPAAEATAIDVFGQVISEVAAANPESVWFDRALLVQLKHLGKLFSEHLLSLRLPRDSVTVDKRVVQNAAQLSDRTPAPRQVRVVGVLDMIRHSTRSFALKMPDGAEVHGVVENLEQVDSLRHLFGKPALVLGKAVYRPSGTLLRIDAQAVESGEGQPALWSKVPPARSEKPKLQRERPTDRGRRGIAAFFGAWPGDETDEEFAAMLQDLRR